MHRDCSSFAGRECALFALFASPLSQRELRNFDCCFGSRQHLTFFVLHNHAIEPQSNARKPRKPMRKLDVMIFTIGTKERTHTTP